MVWIYKNLFKEAKRNSVIDSWFELLIQQSQSNIGLDFAFTCKELKQMY